MRQVWIINSMSLDLAYLCFGRSFCFGFWIFLLPFGVYPCVSRRAIMPSGAYLVALTCIFKFISDLFLLLCYFLQQPELKLVSCSAYSVFFTLELCLHLLYSEIFTFYHRYSLKDVTFLLIFLFVTYFVFVLFMIFPTIFCYLLAFYMVVVYITIKQKMKKLVSHLNSLISIPLQHDQISNLMYIGGYLKSQKSPDIFYAYTITILIIFQFYSSLYTAIALAVFEVYFYMFKVSYVINFVVSRQFYENPIRFPGPISDNLIPLYTVSIDRSLTMMLNGTVLVVTPENHDLYIGQAIDEYSIFI